jgi:hypothetical protein
MRAFRCEVCGQLVFFENTGCLRCGSPLGFVADEHEMRTLRELGPLLVPIRPAPHDGWADETDLRQFRRCANYGPIDCNWLVPDGDPNPWCPACRFTRTRPADSDDLGMQRWRRAEVAKRRLLFQLLELRLPLEGLVFDLLHDPGGSVVTSHHDGVLTIDVAESDDAYRERLRQQFSERYRTLLGHLRHEIGHYYWPVLIEQGGVLAAFRDCFGDERAPYRAALDAYYACGPPAEWPDRHVSAYAAAHPWEDWAETFAHYLHIHDTLQTAAAFGISVAIERTASTPSRDRDDGSFSAVLDRWLPFTYAFNEVARSMGSHDLYPFVLPPVVMEKLAFVHELICPARS